MGRPRLEHRTNRNRSITISASDRDRSTLEARAASANMALSTYMRIAGLNHPIRSVFEITGIEQLAKVSADQTKLGVTLALWMSEQTNRDATEVRRILRGIEDLQQQMRSLAARV